MVDVAKRLEALRGVLKSEQLDAFVVPLTDEHMSEYVGTYAERLKFISDFGGSAGMAIVHREGAAIFTDGRYTLQVRDQVDGDLFSYEDYSDAGVKGWLNRSLKAGETLGYDAELATLPWVEKTSAVLARVGAQLRAVDANPVDQVWDEQPAPPLAPILVHDAQFAGETSADKRARLAASLRDMGVDAAPVSMLDSVAWLFNIRGEDVAHTPVPRGFAILHADGTAALFTDPEKLTPEVETHLGADVSVAARADFYSRLADLGTAGKSVLFDALSHNAKIHKTLSEAGARLVEAPDPTILAKAIKNDVEVQGSVDAHVRDGAAVAEFLQFVQEEAPKGELDELGLVDKLWSCRQQQNLLRDASFDTISGAGPNGAIVHYRVTPETNRPLDQDSLYLVDSGGQYLDGTTDITRTLAIGTPSDEMRARYTLVLQGHIALATTRFAPGTSGMMLDAIARRPLWAKGLDYDHGTGHGVGSFLGVHEGPQRIAKFGTDIPLEPGMILSNEPGYYKAGAYGIRIENLIVVEKVEDAGEREMYGFRTLTKAPLERELIVADMLSDEERAWVDDYHADVLDKLSDMIHPASLEWLKGRCAPL